MPLSWREQFGMLIRGTPVGIMRRCVRRAEAAGLPVSVDQMEAHLLAGGDLERVLDAAIRAKAEGIVADWYRLAALDLTGHDPRGVVERAIPSKRIDWENELRAFRRRPV